MANSRHTRVRISENALIKAIGTNLEVFEYLDKIGAELAYEMQQGQKGVSKRVHRETTHKVIHVGHQYRPVVIVRAGWDTGGGRTRPGFFSVFLELGTKHMSRKMFMREAAETYLRGQGLKTYGYKRYPKRPGSVEWRK